MKCGRCNRDIEQERIEVLPQTRICSGCARILNPPKVKGRMVWSCKTNPEIQVMSAEAFENTKKDYPTFGRGSAVHRISKPTSSL